jgi:hypothetical protein
MTSSDGRTDPARGVAASSAEDSPVLASAPARCRHEEAVQTDVIDKILGWAPTSIRQRYYTRIGDRSLYDAILKLYESDPIERAPLRVMGATPSKVMAAVR